MQQERRENERYDLMLLLDRLETLLEDMDELGIHTREEAAARIAALHLELDELEG